MENGESRAATNWKDWIDEALRCAEIRRLFESDAPPVREREFRASGIPYRADFACALTGGGWLIVEDDDAQRALGNLCKYWLWLSEQEHSGPLYLIHLIGPGLDSQKQLCSFVSEKVVQEIPGFSYDMIRVNNWHERDWMPDLNETLVRIAQHHGNA